jgi:hypothetical protein
MTDLHQTSNRDDSPGIDGVGWLFAAVAAAIIAVAVLIAYEGNDTNFPHAPLSHVVTR